MTVEQIEAAIPHRPPMRLLDAILEQSERRIECEKTFSRDDFFVQGHFPGFQVVPGVIQCECCLQAGAVLLARLVGQREDVVPVATRMDNVKFKRMIRPGETARIEVTLNDQVSNAFFMTGKVTVEGKLAARLDFACSVAQRTA